MSQAPSWLRASSLPAAPTPEESRRGAHVLFVCTGNICRSAFAEVYLRSHLGKSSDVTVSSAGIRAVVGHDLEDHMATEARARHLPATGHTARQLTGRILGGADLVLVFEDHHLQWVLDERPDVLPRTLALGQAEAALAALPVGERLPWRGIAARVHDLRPDPLATDWIPDPYGRGSEAAARSAERISAAIDGILAHVDPGPSLPTSR